MAFYRTAIGSSTLVAALSFMLGTALAHDETKYSDWSGQWRRPPGVGVQWGETKPIGLGQKAPLTLGKENYFMSGDGYLMPARKDQAPPDLRYFKQTRK